MFFVVLDFEIFIFDFVCCGFVNDWLFDCFFFSEELFCFFLLIVFDGCLCCECFLFVVFVWSWFVFMFVVCLLFLINVFCVEVLGCLDLLDLLFNFLLIFICCDRLLELEDLELFWVVDVLDLWVLELVILECLIAFFSLFLEVSVLNGLVLYLVFLYWEEFLYCLISGILDVLVRVFL